MSMGGLAGGISIIGSNIRADLGIVLAASLSARSSPEKRVIIRSYADGRDSKRDSVLLRRWAADTAIQKTVSNIDFECALNVNLKKSGADTFAVYNSSIREDTVKTRRPPPPFHFP